MSVTREKTSASGRDPRHGFRIGKGNGARAGVAGAVIGGTVCHVPYARRNVM